MTREEAIKIINCYDIGFYDLSGEKIPADKLVEAFDMAIEALRIEPTNKSGELFLTLNKAVEVAVNQFNVDPVIARQEFEQKCYIPCSDYEKGFYDGLARSRDAIEETMNERR